MSSLCIRALSLWARNGSQTWIRHYGDRLAEVQTIQTDVCQLQAVRQSIEHRSTSPTSPSASSSSVAVAGSQVARLWPRCLQTCKPKRNLDRRHVAN